MKRRLLLPIGAHPFPGTVDDIAEITLGGPSQYFFGFCGIGDQDRRIAGATRADLAADGLACGLFGCMDYFENGISFAGAEVEGE